MPDQNSSLIQNTKNARIDVSRFWTLKRYFVYHVTVENGESQILQNASSTVAISFVSIVCGECGLVINDLCVKNLKGSVQSRQCNIQTIFKEVTARMTNSNLKKIPVLRKYHFWRQAKTIKIIIIWRKEAKKQELSSKEYSIKNVLSQSSMFEPLSNLLELAWFPGRVDALQGLYTVFFTTESSLFLSITANYIQGHFVSC